MKNRWPIALAAVVLVGIAVYVRTFPPTEPWWDYQPFPTLDPAASTRFTPRTALALLPEAASVPTVDETAAWQKMFAEGRYSTTFYPSHSLSVVVHGLRPEFYSDYEPMGGKPMDWFDATSGGQENPVFLSVLQPENITDVRIESQAGGAAYGVVAYECQRFAGRARFTARRTGGYWRIDEFELLASGVRIRRGASGIWRRIDSAGSFPYLWSDERLRKAPHVDATTPTGGGLDWLRSRGNVSSVIAQRSERRLSRDTVA